jgi:hypothetical protein
MISSEVQRTLVKSPPELWTELSDPESLARHLGELGEIRITRTEPENLVEWEAEGTTGTVEIAPSGWGTRVTLTVLRELPADDGAPEGEADPEVADAGQPEPEASAADVEAEAPAADVESEACAAEAGGSDADTETETEAAPAADAPPEAEAAPETEPVTEAEATPQASAAVPDPADDKRSEPTAERKPAPATEAARRAAGWPSTPHSPGPAIDSEPRAHEGIDGSSPAPDALHEWAEQSAAEAGIREDRQPEDEAPAEPEPAKRGLFARLFGRRVRAKMTVPLEDEGLQAEGPELAAGPEALGETEESEPGAPDNELGEAEAASGAPFAAPAGEESETGELELAEAHGAEPVADAPGIEELGETEVEPAEVETLGEPEPAGAQIAADAPGVTTEDAPPEPAAQGEDPEPRAEASGEAATPVEDLAAELRAAEDVAAEQVEAVLTGVLDRLGSAHHRPFSRS